MSLSLKASGGGINLDLRGEEIIEYRFRQDAPNSKYAKSMFDCEMEIKGDISYMIEHCPEDLEAIRKWVLKEYEGEPEKYYNFVEISFKHRDEIIRTTGFPDAYVHKYKEAIDTHSGQGTFTLILKQKLDKLEWIEFNGIAFGKRRLSKSAAAEKIAEAKGISLEEAKEKIALDPSLRTQAGIAALLAGTSVYSEDPVNLSTGNFVYGVTDIFVNGAYPLHFTRFYNAIDDYTGDLGYNWHHNHEIKLVEKENKDIEIIFDDGHTETYEFNNDEYISDASNHKKLSLQEEFYNLKTKDAEIYKFNKIGNLILKIEENGQETKYEYDENNKLIKVSTMSGSLTFHYSTQGYIEMVSDDSGNEVHYTYSKGNLSRFTNQEGENYKYSYDEKSNRLEGITSPKNERLVYNEYDKEVKTTYQGFPDGTRMEYFYSGDGTSTELIERNGSKTIYYYDEKYRIYKEEYVGSIGEQQGENLATSENVTIEKTFDDSNNIIKYKDKNNNEWQYEYNDSGNVTKEIDPLGNVKEYKYNLSGKLSVIIKADGSEIRYKYDKKGNITETVDELGNSVTKEYNDLGLLVCTTNENGEKTRNEYDKKGNKVTEINYAGDTLKYSYNSSNQVTKVTLPMGNERSIEYTKTGKIKRIYDGEGNPMEYTYDSCDNVETITDFNGNKTSFEYNPLNNQ